jgi:hypothetical protein
MLPTLCLRRRPIEHRAHVPGRAQSSPVGQGPGLRAPSHRRCLTGPPPSPRSPPALAPGTAPLALRNARLPKVSPRFTTLPRPRAPAPKQATRHSGHAFRKLQAQPQSRFVVHNRLNSRSTRRTGAPGTASPGLSNARLFACSG